MRRTWAMRGEDMQTLGALHLGGPGNDVRVDEVRGATRLASHQLTFIPVGNLTNRPDCPRRTRVAAERVLALRTKRPRGELVGRAIP